MIERFRHQTPMTVRFADLDAMGHLNNVQYLVYVEHARIQYIREVLGFDGDWHQLGVILARMEVDFYIPVEFSDEIVVLTRVARMGGKSFDFETFIIRGEDMVSRVVSVMVAYDYRQDVTIQIPNEWREKILAYEPHSKTLE